MNSNNHAETLQEKVRAISDEPVATAISNLQIEYLATAKRLRQLSLQIHGSVLNMLQTEFALRQEETKNAIQEHQHQHAQQQAKEQAVAQRKLEAEQAEVEAANRRGR